MAETTVNIIDMSGVSDDARTYRILAINSKNEIPEGDTVTFNLVFRDKDGNLLFKRALKDDSGNAVTLTSKEDIAVLEYNFIEIEAIYTGTLPADLKVYKF